MEQTVYDADYFISKFSAIPENKYFVGEYAHPNIDSFCALGHCGEHYGNKKFNCDSVKTAESSALRSLFAVHSINVALLNDGMEDKYKQPTPKQRILAALYDIKRAQYPEITQPPVTIEDIIGKEELVTI